MISCEIEGPGEVKPPRTGSVKVSEAMESSNKQNIFDLMRDPILRPIAYDQTIYLNHFTKASWSPVPFYRGWNTDARCLLALLTSTHQLTIHARKVRRYSADQEYTDPWEMLIDVSSKYNRILLKEWARSDVETELEDNPTIKFEEYRNRLYKRAIVDCIWLPVEELDSDFKATDSTKGVFASLFMTFHANGDACIWQVSTPEIYEPKYSCKILHRERHIFHVDQTVSATAFIHITAYLGLLVVGTNQGCLKILRVLKTLPKVKRERVEDGSEASLEKSLVPETNYLIKEEIIAWEEDMIRVESVTLNRESESKISILVVKHPNIILGACITVDENREKIACGDFSVLPVPYGPIVGISFANTYGLILVMHEKGALSTVLWNQSVLESIPNFLTLLFDPSKQKKPFSVDYGTIHNKLLAERPKKSQKKLDPSEKTLIFQGLGVSPNNAMLCVGRTLGMYYDHLKIRRPSQLVFYSILPKDITWSYIQKLYEENSNSLRAIADALVAFRLKLRETENEEIYREILDWAVPLNEKSSAELRLLHWCLKIRPGPPQSEFDVAVAEKVFNPFYWQKLIATEALFKYRADLVADRIMERRCVNLIKAVIQNQNEPDLSLNSDLNKQSLNCMYEYLESKAESFTLPPKPVFSVLPTIPLCFWCKGPIEFPIEKFDYFSPCLAAFDESGPGKMTEFDNERITGYKWKSRRHPVKEFGVHRPEICILSFVPITVPYRKCSNCSVVALMKPAFNQQPYCPLCDAFMHPVHLPVSTSDDEIDENFKDKTKERSSIEDPSEVSTSSQKVFIQMVPSDGFFNEPEDPEPSTRMEVDEVGSNEWVDLNLGADDTDETEDEGGSGNDQSSTTTTSDDSKVRTSASDSDDASDH